MGIFLFGIVAGGGLMLLSVIIGWFEDRATAERDRIRHEWVMGEMARISREAEEFRRPLLAAQRERRRRAAEAERRDEEL